MTISFRNKIDIEKKLSFLNHEYLLLTQNCFLPTTISADKERYKGDSNGYDQDDN